MMNYEIELTKLRCNVNASKCLHVTRSERDDSLHMLNYSGLYLIQGPQEHCLIVALTLTLIRAPYSSSERTLVVQRIQFQEQELHCNTNRRVKSIPQPERGSLNTTCFTLIVLK